MHHVKSFIYCILKKKERKTKKITVCSDAPHKSLQQTTDELWKGRGKPDKLMCVCVCVSLAMLHESV